MGTRSRQISFSRRSAQILQIHSRRLHSPRKPRRSSPILATANG